MAADRAPRIIVRASPRAAAAAAATQVAEALSSRNTSVALPTGRTAMLLYAELRRLVQERQITFASRHIFQLDEFAGIRRADPRSFAAFLRTHLLDHVDMTRAHVHWFDGRSTDLRREAARYDALIARTGGLDLALLGIGGNGHIAFNEPGNALIGPVHLAELSRATRAAQQYLFGRVTDVPTRALTLGVATILRARRVILLATGHEKAAVVARAVDGPITPRLPASLLQAHPNATIVLDCAAARGARRRGR